jgi:flagellar FliJ protein
MKKFQFSLETVLDYRQQTLDALKVEHGRILAKVHRQEEVLKGAERRYASTNEEFRSKKSTGLTIAGLCSYQTGLHVLEQEIKHETEKLEALRKQEAEKRAQLVDSKINTASLELLREKKLQIYHKELQKKEEQFIDELVISTRSVATSLSLPIRR